MPLPLQDITFVVVSSSIPITNYENVIAFEEMHSSAVLSWLVFIFVKSRLELVRVTRETSRHRDPQSVAAFTATFGPFWLRFGVRVWVGDRVRGWVGSSPVP